ncbi:hypothetical protein SK128_014519 [Halocaridina rubra]|uniref:Uncharacterized protein n=1 Tax=Halocaridina rubra TaxID=373956 RepID=A0AAN8XPN4_HALRR
MWDIIYHEMLAISNLSRVLSGVRMQYQQDVNNFFSKCETEFGERNIQAILTVMEKKECPFMKDATQPNLHNIMTQEVMTGEIQNQVLQVKATGTTAYERNYVRKGQEASGKSQRKREDKQRQCVIKIARARGSSMKELLEYDLTSSCYLFDDQGLLAMGSKSALINEDAKKHLDYSKYMQVGYIADVMAYATEIVTKEFSNFCEFAGALVDYIQKSAKGADRIAYIFDSSFDISIKGSERKRRETISPIELNVVSEETPIPVQMEQFCTVIRNKHNLEILVHQTAINHA